MIKNLTPHSIIIYKDGSVLRTFQPEGIVPRCQEERIQIGEIEGIPDKQEGVFLIVSPIVANALPDRDDLLVPDILVRDGQGNIIGSEALARISWWGCQISDI